MEAHTDFFQLAHHVCVVTGAAGLLGQQFADALCEHGANVVVTDMVLPACEQLAETLRKRHPRVRVEAVAADITDAADVVRLKDDVLRWFGRIDVLVNNAAIDDKFTNGVEGEFLSRFENYPLERWRRQLEVNITGTFLCCQVLGAEMSERRSGSIVNVASTYGLVAPQQALYKDADGRQTFLKGAAYPTSKAAVLGLTRFLASYWGERQVRVNALCPGGVRNGQSEFFVERYTERTPLQRMAEASDYRGAIVFLASDASRYMTGAQLVVDGGWTVW